MAVAMPGWFARPGAGVTRLPLEVTAFDAPGFGDVSDAINLASGNIYLDVGGLSRNNELKTGDEQQALFGNWNMSSRLRLEGYHKAIATPTELSLASGDGSRQRFAQVTPDFTTAPRWITRTQGTANVLYYKSQPQVGTQTVEAWLVLVPVSGGKIAHHYDHTGSRTTFWNDGEYADYAQNAHQQYQGAVAAAADPEGTATAFKTEFTYTGLNSGRLAKVKDQWGRVTTYSWNADNTLASINALLNSEADSGSWARKIDFNYEALGGQTLVTEVTFRTTDGKGNLVARTFDLDYTYLGSRVLLKTVRRPTLSSGSDLDKAGKGWRETTYSYSTDGTQLIKVSQTGEADTSYAYGSSAESGGRMVTATQGDVRNEFHFDAQGQLALRKVRDSNADAATDRTLVWKYQYYPNGFTAGVTEPSGKTTHYDYDAGGNLTRASTYAAATSNTAASSSALPHPEVSGPLRRTTFTYDRDHRLIRAVTNSPSDGSYGYQAVTEEHTYSDYSNVAGTFFALSQDTEKTLVGTVVKRRTVTTYDDQGRVTTQALYSGNNATTTRTLQYTYGDGTAATYPVLRDGGTQDTPLFNTARQYGDLIRTATTTAAGAPDAVTTTFTYDRFGSPVRETGPRFQGVLAGSAQLRTREILRNFNGFGQKTAEWHYADDGERLDAARQGWRYYASGELDASWSGTAQNVTDLQYAETGTNLGRLVKTVRGAGDMAAKQSLGDSTLVTAAHETVTLTYDTSGRVSAKTTDGAFTTSYSYDTLDRVTRETRPDGGWTRTRYDLVGEPAQVELRETDGRLFTATTTRDSLGRITSQTAPGRGTLTTSYDPYDRPVKVVNDSLTMNVAGDDRATFLAYDSLGNLIKRLEPALVSGGGAGYTDARRPYAEYSYDDLGRLTTTTQLLGGTVTPSSMSLPAGASTAVTRTEYDGLDRVTKVTDPRGFTTTRAYDPSGNLRSATRQVCVAGDATCTAGADGLDASGSVTESWAYDPAGREVLSVNGRGHSRKTSYDLLGNVTTKVNERGIVERAYTYTPDGLVESIYEPRLGSGDLARTFNPANFDRVEFRRYGSRVYPDTIYQAHMNTAAGDGSGARSDLTYDYAGRTLTTTLPADQNGLRAVVTQRYDGRGNLTYKKDQDGFVTQHAYDGAGQLVSKVLPARTDSAGAVYGNDSYAGLAGGLSSTYTYDLAGNLTKKAERGLITEYAYNSLGKVVRESRPRVGETTGTNFKYTTYRLDGLTTAATTYGYAGDLLTAKVASVSTTNLPTVTNGNVNVFDLDASGNITAEIAQGFWKGTASNWQSTERNTYDGRNLRVKRSFEGSTAIYQGRRLTDGTNTNSANYLTFWKFDATGKLLEAYDTLPDGTHKVNAFTYTYSPTGKELTQTQDVQVRTKSSDPNNQLWSQGGSQGLLLAGVKGSANASYNERDLLASVTVTQSIPEPVDTASARFSSFGPSKTSTQTYTYYKDGRRFEVNGQDPNGGTASALRRVDSYDGRGRETSVYDSNSDYGAANVLATYDTDGMVTREVRSLDGYTNYYEVVAPTLDGLTYAKYDSISGRWHFTTYSQSGQALVGVPYQQNDDLGNITATVGYDAYGNAATSSTTDGTTTNTYDDNNHLVQAVGPSGTVSYNLDARGNRLSVTGGEYDGFQKRYDAEERAARFASTSWVYRCTASTCVVADTWRWDDFRYDPFGQQIISSVAGVQEYRGATGFEVRRDGNTTTTVEGLTQQVAVKYDTYEHEQIDTTTPVILRSLAVKRKDQSYSLADAYQDDTDWSGVVLFGAKKGSVQKLSAPVRPLSDQLKINPSDVRPPSKDEVKPQQDSGKVKPLDAKVTPLEAPVRALPSTVAPINPGTVKAPSASTPSPADHVNLTSEVPNKPAVNLGKTSVPRIPKAVPQRNVRTLDAQDRVVQALGFIVTPINQPDSAGEATNLDFRVRYNQQSQLTQYSNYTAFDKQADDSSNALLDAANSWGGTGALQYANRINTVNSSFGISGANTYNSTAWREASNEVLEPERPFFGVNSTNYYRNYSETRYLDIFSNTDYDNSGIDTSRLLADATHRRGVVSDVYPDTYAVAAGTIAPPYRGTPTVPKTNAPGFGVKFGGLVGGAINWINSDVQPSGFEADLTRSEILSGRQVSQRDRNNPDILYHYTTPDNLVKIVYGGVMLPSVNPQNARFGPGYYFTDYSPYNLGAMWKSDLPNNWKQNGLFSVDMMAGTLYRNTQPATLDKLGAWIAVDTKGLNPVRVGHNMQQNPDTHNYLVPWLSPYPVLVVRNRIAGYGLTPYIDQR